MLPQCFLSFNEPKVTLLIFHIKTSGFSQSGYCVITKESHTCPTLSPHRNQSPPLTACKFQQYCSILLHLSCDQEKPEAHYFRNTGVLCLLTTQQGDVMVWCGVKALSHKRVCTFYCTASGWLRTSWGWIMLHTAAKYSKTKIKICSILQMGSCSKEH